MFKFLFSPSRRTREQDKELFSKWMRRGMYILILVVMVNHYQPKLYDKISQDLPFDDEENIERESLVTEEAVEVFRPSISVAKEGEGALRLRCGDEAMVRLFATKADGKVLVAQDHSFVLGQQDVPDILVQMTDGMMEKEVRQVIVDPSYFSVLYPEEKAEKNVAMNVSLISLKRQTPIENSNCQLVSEWKDAIDFR